MMGTFAASEADARPRRHHHTRHVGRAVYNPPSSAMVLDANTGKTLYASNENQLRHPASVTKVMTLYLLFEQLDKGKLHLNDDITISHHAASMSPSKLGLSPGSTISVDNAIKAIVTKSANDIAAAIAETIGGTEDRFAKMMTAKAHALGMKRTHYANASGLPNPAQITTARDLITLGRAMRDRFPRYYAYFSIHEFNYAGMSMRNHNHLLDRVEGMDGIKTGFTAASGFNLLTSVKRGNRRIVAVVLGGRSAGLRDRTMVGLVKQYFDRASPVRTAGLVTEETPVADNDVGADTSFDVAEADIVEEKKPEIKAPAIAPRQVVAAAPVAAAIVAAPAKFDDRTASIPTSSTNQKTLEAKRTDRVTAGVITGATSPTTTPTQNGNMRWVAGGAKPAVAANAPQNTTKVGKETQDTPRPALASKGMMIQVGVSDDLGKAKELLTKAKSKGHAALASAQPFTEKLQKGGETLYRARFAMLNETQAEAACRSLKKSHVSCFSTRN